MKYVGSLALALAFAVAMVAAARPAAPSDASASDGFAARATRFFEEARRRDCDGRPDGPARRACVDAALAAVYPPGFAAHPGEGAER